MDKINLLRQHLIQPLFLLLLILVNLLPPPLLPSLLHEHCQGDGVRHITNPVTRSVSAAISLMRYFFLQIEIFITKAVEQL